MGHLIRNGQFHKQSEETEQGTCENREERIYAVIEALSKMGDYSSIRELLDPHGRIGLTGLESFAEYLRKEHPDDYRNLHRHGCLKTVA